MPGKIKCFHCTARDVIRSSEYTPKQLADHFGQFSEQSIEQLKTFPCLFAYEEFCGGPPLFGWLKNIKIRSNDMVMMECEYVSVDPWLTEPAFKSIQPGLDIHGWEMSRSHWALKDVDLAEELAPLGIVIPGAKLDVIPTVDPQDHNFDIAFSFPGEARSFVEKVILELVMRSAP